MAKTHVAERRIVVNFPWLELMDALLADLQSTTSHIASYQQGQQHSPASPEPIYEPQMLKQQYHTASSSSSVSKTNYASQQGAMVGPPTIPPPTYASVLEDQKPPSALTANLSELDMLLQDLSSAQFMDEVDRRNAANVSQGSVAYHPPPPPTQVTRAPGESMVSQSSSSHYEQVQRVQGTAAPPGITGASTATRELEDLMASLSEFKVAANTPQHIGEPPYAQPHKPARTQQLMVDPVNAAPGPAPPPAPIPVATGPAPPPPGVPVAKGPPQPQGMAASYGVSSSMQGAQMATQGVSGVNASGAGVGPGVVVEGSQMAASGAQAQMASSGQMQQGQDVPLETMLGNLNTDMTRQGIVTVPKGHCAACAKPIVGQVITALGKIWHPEHFICAHCKEELGTMNFYEREGFPYCERDYHNLFSPKCAGCNGPILDKCITALDSSWHPEHFTCAKCGCQFGEEGFHEKNGKAYCREDYFELFAPKCGGCARPIMDNYISALNRQWHPECFVCMECHAPLEGVSYYERGGRPYCRLHSHGRRGSLCACFRRAVTG